ncbi:hypothetical protein [Dietzia sp. SYD-A1]|uniref:hypothetical protein n=1 Tax=Dietzia sp. SYD-A1 TaxID=2780141 RepID=UPI0018917D38|nr:hypothetical protein [Dietzia sp. SYD-A1]
MAVNTMDGPSRHGGPDDDEATRLYLDQISALHRDWDELESRGDDSVQLSRRARSALTEAVRADARHGARVQMPPTDVGPYSLTELALRTLIRDTVDDVPGVVSLRTAVDHEPGAGWGTRGLPRRIACRVSLAITTPDLPALADAVRQAVRAACAREFDLVDLVVDVHIEDLHEN